MTKELAEASARPSRRELKSTRREAAVVTALDLAEREGVSGLTMRRLGDEMAVDPTTLYRLFRDKDELLLAVYDHVLSQNLAAVQPVDGEVWSDTLRRVADQVWRSAARYPAVTALTFARTTGGPAERRMVELILTAFARAGLSRAEAVLYYRAFIDAALSVCGQSAVFSTLDPEVRAKDAAAWSRIYAQLPGEDYPTVREHIEDLTAIADRAVYDAVVEAVLAAAERAAATS
ncbi:TetR/AcrR family transcriptional regulator [Nocardia rhizosphaerihabitans]|uniref:TetR/AcrR family transcriptional regulator n=1 Tax=Nocardia rhizosphaerihabitans TaxID=1691570 RepID=UPI00366F9905